MSHAALSNIGKWKRSLRIRCLPTSQFCSGIICIASLTAGCLWEAHEASTAAPVNSHNSRKGQQGRCWRVVQAVKCGSILDGGSKKGQERAREANFGSMLIVIPSVASNRVSLEELSCWNAKITVSIHTRQG
ncbi:uncharacterized protein LOC121106540 isoform X1 [Gallus gallus]|uniref:uncharacterized protein LOC121106540 isoform X1 n=1 Tax=Gallus gallus TaxID=9031 RepID=UPI001AE1F3E2|nr:uncharacterized protein LOC121106540 isoform X1 [Gallus gallus]XP_040518393.1 uncharacterized protein LOC121106540 isoform X1 [Gallus gallus]XP_040518394.1 uncharacterized protein LOC121106540 isoform X1 [Gallus gallus]XP_040518395.1 uncharacterized protein LOC121106540 isoform X1 [Gallus gallus]XP_046765227.1 uncharacterized protein LOC121106540 isoform X1 [Gallus gallus]